MQSKYINEQPVNFSELLEEHSTLTEQEIVATKNQPTYFQGQYKDSMEMYSDAETVAEYLDAHQDWFCRCAQPMKVEPLGENGYTLVIGRFGSFGYEVEPKIGVELLPPEQWVYRMRTIPVPNYDPIGYEVDYQATLKLVETPLDLADRIIERKEEKLRLSPVVTKVEWQLDLGVAVQFPKFIHKLPKSLIQTTGDRLLGQVVRQVSRRLTYKVQEDFHCRYNLPIPPRPKKRQGRQ